MQLPSQVKRIFRKLVRLPPLLVIVWVKLMKKILWTSLELPRCSTLNKVRARPTPWLRPIVLLDPVVKITPRLNSKLCRRLRYLDCPKVLPSSPTLTPYRRMLCACPLKNTLGVSLIGKTSPTKTRRSLDASRNLSSKP